jgi:hypothetical protein
VKSRQARRYIWDDYFRYAWMVYYAVLLHGIWALMLLASDDPFGSTPVNSLFFGHRFVTAAVLLAASLMAVRGIRRKGTRAGWMLIVPQQVLLMVSAVGGVVAAFLGHYADGVARPGLFIAADQLPGVVAAVCHTFAMVDLHRRHRVRRIRSSVTLH